MFDLFRERLRVIKDAWVVPVADATHHLHLDQAERVSGTVLAFLTDPALLPARGEVPRLRPAASKL